MTRQFTGRFKPYRNAEQVAELKERVRALVLDYKTPKEICAELGLKRTYHETIIKELGFARVFLLPEEREIIKARRKQT